MLVVGYRERGRLDDRVELMTKFLHARRGAFAIGPQPLLERTVVLTGSGIAVGHHRHLLPRSAAAPLEREGLG